MMANKWIKLNASWMESEWVITLSAEARLAWVQLLCYAKTHGFGGRVKIKPPMVFARQSFIGEESVEQMLRAAKKDGALREENGEWIITGWQKHQGGDETTVDRSKRYRERKAGVTDRDVTRDARDVTAEEKRGEEKRVTTPKPPGGAWTWKLVRDSFTEVMPESHHKAITEFCAYHRDLGTKPWTKSTIEKRAAFWGEWPAARFRAAVDHTILRGWKGLAEPDDKGLSPSGSPAASGPTIRRRVGAPDA